MEQTGHVAGWVDQLDDMAVHVTDAMLRAGAGVQAPTVHVLVDDLDPAYVGKLGCRPMLRGRDAHAAIAVMGLFGSMLGASRLVVTYEHADMARAWEDPAADTAPTGVVVVDAARDPAQDGHTIRWHPALFTEGPDAADDGPAVLAHWGPPAQYRAGRLPSAVARLLSIWREPRSWDEREFLRVLAGWEQGGYSLRWVQRPDGEQRQPGWMRLLAPIM
ncbi:hypothetical protein [Pseudonocardia nigra]|uniref:hypothetical protein n=1 Tax=Pseudonocardia nigra TaxID=1921578 RepID=UPI001C5CE14F|nr:hypothetical protein [Pseudonocardia nigra]